MVAAGFGPADEPPVRRAAQAVDVSEVTSADVAAAAPEVSDAVVAGSLGGVAVGSLDPVDAPVVASAGGVWVVVAGGVDPPRCRPVCPR